MDWGDSDVPVRGDYSVRGRPDWFILKQVPSHLHQRKPRSLTNI
jgi:hypothetical protein